MKRLRATGISVFECNGGGGGELQVSNLVKKYPLHSSEYSTHNAFFNNREHMLVEGKIQVTEIDVWSIKTATNDIKLCLQVPLHSCNSIFYGWESLCVGSEHHNASVSRLWPSTVEQNMAGSVPRYSAT